MLINDFDFELPEELIARYPTEKRDLSRLLHYQRNNKLIKHRQFIDLPELLQDGDVLVRNNSKVLAARFKLNNEQGSTCEILLTEMLNENRTLWQALVKPGKKIKTEKQKFFISEDIAVNIWRQGDDFFVEFQNQNDFLNATRDHGYMPLPPYMKRDAENIDRERYQTIYAQETSTGASVAAPTAGLHFTEEINNKLKSKGISIIDTCLHVGIGTFAPIRSDDIRDHKMHHEYYEVNPQAWDFIQDAKDQGRRIIAVGSTSARVLETIALTEKLEGKTNIYIYPSFDFKIIDAMITNFHLPKSSLMLMISAFLGTETVKDIYKQAIEQRYRFFSYGDCCLFE